MGKVNVWGPALLKGSPDLSDHTPYHIKSGEGYDPIIVFLDWSVTLEVEQSEGHIKQPPCLTIHIIKPHEINHKQDTEIWVVINRALPNEDKLLKRNKAVS